MIDPLWRLIFVPISLMLFVVLLVIIYVAIDAVRDYKIERLIAQDRKRELNDLVRKFREEMFTGGEDNE